MGHEQRERLKDYWSKLEHFYTAFYGNTMKVDNLSYTEISAF
jgi:hypothetical protein